MLVTGPENRGSQFRRCPRRRAREPLVELPGRRYGDGGLMRVHDMIVDERRRAAELLAGLSAAQLSAPSLCEGWTVHEVAAHLTTFLRLGQAKLYVGILVTGA